MRIHSLVRLPFVIALAVALLLGPRNAAEAQSPTDDIVKCLDGAANTFKQCVDDLPWYAEALCYARYASDGILCAPGVALEALK